MSSLSAGRVSLGGRRNSTAPPGKDIERNIADSTTEPASMLRIQEGRSHHADIIHPVVNRNTARCKLRRKLRKDFNLHLLRPNVVGDVFRSHCQLVGSRNRLLWDE